MIHLLGTVAAILTTAAFLPQAIKVIKTRSTADLSVTTYGLLWVGTLCWLVYGLSIGNLPVVFSNAITGALAAVILWIKLQSLGVGFRGLANPTAELGDGR